MERIWYFKLTIVIAIVLASGVCVWGALPERYRPSFITEHIHTQLQLGLDLSGGVRLVYEVLIDDAVRQRRRQTAEGLRSSVSEDLHVRNVSVREEGDSRFYLLFESQADAAKCTHAFVRQNGWAEDRGRSAASEAHFEVDAESTRSTREVARQTQRRVQEALGLDELRMELLPNRRFALLLPEEAGLDRLQGELVEGFADVDLVGRYHRKIEFQLDDDALEHIVDTAVSQAMEVIGNRIDELGVANTTVSQSGTSIIIEIPARTAGGEQDVEQSEYVARVKRIIERTARLEFRIADDQERAIYGKLRPLVNEDARVEIVQGDSDFFLRAADTKTSDGEVVPGNKILAEFIERAVEKGIELPENRDFRFEKIPQGRQRGQKTAAATDNVWRSYYLNREAQVTGEHIADAMVAYEQQGPEAGLPYVSLDFNERGRKAFGQITKANVGKRMAIVLDDRVNSAPVIQEAILGGRARITLGSYGDRAQLIEEARDLVVVLRAGGLPAPISLINEETIGPQLGADAIRQGQISLVVGAVLVLLFMLVYYRGGGLIADVALAINVGMIFAVLGLLGATLTLPGLAGIVLTVGMSVDANVIIYERIREELRAGKSPRAAVDAGYSRAFWTIFDAQFTTLIAAVVLLDQGTGPIKGFAVTLLIGVVTSMVSAIFISRVVFDWVTRRKRLERLSI